MYTVQACENGYETAKAGMVNSRTDSERAEWKILMQIWQSRLAIARQGKESDNPFRKASRRLRQKPAVGASNGTYNEHFP